MTVFLCVSVFLCAVLLMGQVPEIKWIGLDWIFRSIRILARMHFRFPQYYLITQTFKRSHASDY